MKVGSLFSGVGGIDLAFERAGFTVAWQVEWNKDAQSVLRRHWPHVPLYGDITTVDPAELEPVDVVAFGSPCQDLSVAGKRAGLGGERSGLFYEAIRIIAGVRPSFAVWENVPGALSSNAGRDFAAVLAAFRECGAREIGWRILDAQYCGVPQRRRRIFLVADFGGERASQILFEREGVSGHPPTRCPAGSVVASLLANGAGTSCPGGQGAEPGPYVTQALPMECEVTSLDVRNLNDNGDISGTIQAKTNGGYSLNYINPIVIQDVRGLRDKKQNGIGITEDDLVYTLDATSQHGVAYALRADPGGVGQGHNTNYIVEPTAKMLTARTLLGKGNDSHDDSLETYIPVAHTLRAEGSDASEDGTGRGTPLVPVYGLSDQPISKFGVNIAPTLSTEQSAVTIGMAVRRLMPIETERLQGLPDDHTRWSADGKELSDSARYRLVGNSVAVPVVEWLAIRLKTRMGKDD